MQIKYIKIQAPAKCTKIRRMVKSLRTVKIRRMVKSLWPVKIRWMVKVSRVPKTQRVPKTPWVPKTQQVPKTLRVLKTQRVPKIRWIRISGQPSCLGSAESASADISLVPLMSTFFSSLVLNLDHVVSKWGMGCLSAAVCTAPAVCTGPPWSKMVQIHASAWFLSIFGDKNLSS